MPHTEEVAGLSAVAGPGEVCVLSPIRDRRRSSIVTAALALAVNGYDAVALRVVADRAGVATGTVYQYFSSKDDLLMACFHRWIVTSELAFHHELALVADPAERLHRV
ncbi:MAG: TetR/AcrR family transcriptional regulator, partial [Mycobacterium sp.]